MVIFSNCKINLGLHIVGKRDDGYHNLETVFFPLPFYDVVEVIYNAEHDAAEFFLSGIEIQGGSENNLCLKAYELLKKDFSQLPASKIYLHKNIPVGAGLGGGSANGAFTLQLLNDKYSLHLTESQLLNYALKLGSDCPFFIKNKPCFAQQRGEVLEEIDLDLSAYKIILVNPGIHINTGWAFSQVNPSKPKKNIKEIVQQPASTWKTILINDFEAAVFKAHPSIQKIKNMLYETGAVYASMSGSGSTVFAIFEKHVEIDIKNFPNPCIIKEVAL